MVPGWLEWFLLSDPQMHVQGVKNAISDCSCNILINSPVIRGLSGSSLSSAKEELIPPSAMAEEVTHLYKFLALANLGYSRQKQLQSSPTRRRDAYYLFCMILVGRPSQGGGGGQQMRQAYRPECSLCARGSHCWSSCAYQAQQQGQRRLHPHQDLHASRRLLGSPSPHYGSLMHPKLTPV